MTIGQDVNLDKLREVYTAVVLAYGADDDRTFGIPGEVNTNTGYCYCIFSCINNAAPSSDAQFRVHLDCDSRENQKPDSDSSKKSHDFLDSDSSQKNTVITES